MASISNSEENEQKSPENESDDDLYERLERNISKHDTHYLLFTKRIDKIGHKFAGFEKLYLLTLSMMILLFFTTVFYTVENHNLIKTEIEDFKAKWNNHIKNYESEMKKIMEQHNFLVNDEKTNIVQKQDENEKPKEPEKVCPEDRSFFLQHGPHIHNLSSPIIHCLDQYEIKENEVLCTYSNVLFKCIELKINDTIHCHQFHHTDNYYWYSQVHRNPRCPEKENVIDRNHMYAGNFGFMTNKPLKKEKKDEINWCSLISLNQAKGRSKRMFENCRFYPGWLKEAVCEKSEIESNFYVVGEAKSFYWEDEVQYQCCRQSNNNDCDQYIIK